MWKPRGKFENRLRNILKFKEMNCWRQFSPSNFSNLFQRINSFNLWTDICGSFNQFEYLNFQSEKCDNVCKLSQCEIASVFCTHTDQVNVVIILHSSFNRNSTDHVKTTACFCENKSQYSFNTTTFHTLIMLGLQKPNFKKTVVGILVVFNFLNLQLRFSVWTHHFFLVMKIQCQSVNSRDYLIQSIQLLKKFWKRSDIQTAFFLSFPQIKWTFVVGIIHFSFIEYSADQNKTPLCFSGRNFRYYSHVPNFNARIMLEMQKQNLYRTVVSILIFNHCWKSKPHRKQIRSSFCFLFES